MEKQNIVLYPITVEIKNIEGNWYDYYKSYLKKIVNQHSNKEWNKLIKEFKDTVKDFDDMYGLKITNVKKYKKDFIISTVEVINEEKFKNWGEEDILPKVFTSFINHNLEAGGYPSFYKENNDIGKTISSYVFIETTYLK